MSKALDRMAIMEKSPDPEAMAAEIHRQVGYIDGAVDLAVIMRGLELKGPERRNLEGPSGVIRMNAQKTFGKILVEKGHIATKQKFSIAHEIGHFLFDGHVPQREADGSSGLWVPNAENLSEAEIAAARKVYEKEANAFAAALLMPEVAIRPFLELEPSIEVCMQVQEHFAVSFGAANRRLVSLSPHPLGLVTFDAGLIKSVEGNQNFPEFAVGKKQTQPIERPTSPQRIEDWRELDLEFWLVNPPPGQLVGQITWQAGTFATVLLKFTAD